MELQHVVRGAPRFVFLTDQVEARANRGPVVTDGRVAWRLLAANNRAMGRSAITFGSVEDCYSAALELHLGRASATYSAVFNSEQSRWGWTLMLDGAWVATSAHQYHRRIECLRGLRQFVESLAAAVPDMDEVRHIGPRSLGVYKQADFQVTSAGYPVTGLFARPDLPAVEVVLK
ncbi:hypothetical protein ACSMXN_03765 [Jatrophihabitans sp. DSM 45814]